MEDYKPVAQADAKHDSAVASSNCGSGQSSRTNRCQPPPWAARNGACKYTLTRMAVSHLSIPYSSRPVHQTVRPSTPFALIDAIYTHSTGSDASRQTDPSYIDDYAGSVTSSLLISRRIAHPFHDCPRRTHLRLGTCSLSASTLQCLSLPTIRTLNKLDIVDGCASCQRQQHA